MSFAGGQTRLGASFSQQSPVGQSQVITSQSLISAPLATLQVNDINASDVTASGTVTTSNLVAPAIITTGTNQDMTLTPNGTGKVTTTKDVTVGGTLTVPTIITSGTNQNLTLTPNGTGKVTTSKDVTITSSTASTTTATGALVCSGGVGIAGAVYCGGSVRAPNLFLSNTGTASVSTLSTNANLSLAPNGTGIVTTPSPFTVTNSTASTSTTTGCAVFSGGIGCIGTGYFSAINAIAGTFGSLAAVNNFAISSTGSPTLSLTTDTGSGGSAFATVIDQGAPRLKLYASNSPTAALEITSTKLAFAPNGSGALGDASFPVLFAYPTRVSDTTESTSTASGAIVTDGGIGCAKNAYVGGNIVGSATTTTTTRTLTSPGGNQLTITNGAGSSSIELLANDVQVTGYLFPNADNTQSLGKSGRRWFDVWANNGTIQTSSESRKDHKPLANCLSKVVQLKTVKYKWKNRNPDEEDREHYGLLAEDVKELFPEIVYGEGEDSGLCYAEIIPTLVKAIQELNAKVRRLENPTRSVSSVLINSIAEEDDDIQPKQKKRRVK